MPTEDTCPECGEEYITVTKGIDRRPGGALFDTYVHSYEEGSTNMVEKYCTHIREWGEESAHAEE